MRAAPLGMGNATTRTVLVSKREFKRSLKKIQIDGKNDVLAFDDYRWPFHGR
jgi:hypothetical protein